MPETTHTHMRNHATVLVEIGFHIFPINYPRLSSSFTGSAPKSTEKYTCSCHSTRFRRALQPDELKRGMKHVYERGVCEAVGKHPITIKGVFEESFKGATRDQERIKTAWTKHPDANIGIGQFFTLPDGTLRRIIAIDIDGSLDAAKDGEVTIKALEAKHGALPRTLEAKSGRIVEGRAIGGRHLIYLIPLSWEGTFKRTLGPGVDIKCAGVGYVAAPPSLHKSGQRYEWLVLQQPVEAPAWLMEACARSVGPEEDKGGTPARPTGDPFEAGSLLSDAVHGLWWVESSGGELEMIEAALRAVDKEYDPARSDRPFLSPDLFKELHWSLRALQDWFAREPGVGELAFAHAHQFAGHHEGKYFSTLWNYRRPGGRMYGRGHLLAMADAATPGHGGDGGAWRASLSAAGRAAAARVLDLGGWVANPYTGALPGELPAVEPAGAEGKGRPTASIAPLSPQGPGGSGGGIQPPIVPQQPGGGGQRPLIRVQGGGLPFEADAAERFLIGMEEPIFTRGQTLVRPITEKAADCKGDVTDTPALLTVTSTNMRDTIARRIQWEHYDGRSKKWLATNPSKEHAEIIMSRTGNWNFPLLRGIISTPMLRRDGSLIQKQGYDQKSKMFLERPLPLPWFHDAPTRDDALTALADLSTLIEECAFVEDDGASKAAALSALITPGIRPMMAVAPIHVANAPKAGTGKSYVYDVSASIWLGGKCPAVAASEDPVETEKRLVGAVIRGLPIINLDNVSGELSSDFLCQAVSQDKMQIRPLGSSADALVSNTATIFASGNNIVLRGDITRRAVIISLDARMADPEQRVFKQNPVEMVRENRGHYVACALTIVKAYIAAGSPKQKGVVLNGFEDWSRLVRDALMWLGCADSVKTMAGAKASDPDRVNLEATVTAFRDSFGEKECQEYRTITSLITTIASGGSAFDGLKSVLSEWSRNGEINLRSLGKAFHKFNNQIVDFKDDKTGVISSSHEVVHACQPEVVLASRWCVDRRQ